MTSLPSRHRASGATRLKGLTAVLGVAALLGIAGPATAQSASGRSDHLAGSQRVTHTVRTAAVTSQQMVGVAPTSDAGGYWLASSSGNVYTYGTAAYYGSLGTVALAKPIVGIAPAAGDKGYWMVASDGGIFAFGNAPFYGSTGSVHLAQPIVGMAATPSGKGYWLVASDGGIFAFGDARFYGSTGGVHLDQPIVGMAATPSGNGYWMVASDGGIFAFGDASFQGSAVNFDASAGAQAVGLIAVQSGYWVPNNEGGVDSFGAPAPPAATGPLADQKHTPVLPVNENPASSIPPTTAFAYACWVSDPNLAACNSAALTNINNARATEGLGPLVLPSDFYSLGTVSQLVAVANAERTSRGLAALPENTSLDQAAAQGAVGGYDPIGPNGYNWGSNISWGSPTALSADYGWMYDDGPNSPNIDCKSAGDPGCWGHRDNILAQWPSGAAGGGYYDNKGTIQLTQLFVDGY